MIRCGAVCGVAALVDNSATGRYEKDKALPQKAAQQQDNEQL